MSTSVTTAELWILGDSLDTKQMTRVDDVAESVTFWERSGRHPDPNLD